MDLPASLYCAQGLPSGLMAHSLPVLLRQNGVDLALIGLLKLLALPWMLKVLWAPWIDRLASPRLGHHRGWILPLQGLVLLCMATLALCSPEALFGRQQWLLFGLLLLVNLAAATQDIAPTASPCACYPSAGAVWATAYRWAATRSACCSAAAACCWLWTGSAGTSSLGLTALLLALLSVPVWRFRETRELPRLAAQAERAGPGLLWRHYHGLLAQPGMHAWLLVVLTFKLGDALGSPMIKPLLVDQGWSNAALGQLTLITSLAGIGGALFGGLLYARLGARRSLLLFGVLQAVGIAGMALWQGPLRICRGCMR